MASSLTATMVAAVVSAAAHARIDLSLGGAILGVALVSGLAVFAVLSWRRQAQLERELERLERASWPGWMQDIGAAALGAGVKVFCEGQFVVFQRSSGERHLLIAEPAGTGMGRTLERQKALSVLSNWGVRVHTGTRGQLLPEIDIRTP